MIAAADGGVAETVYDTCRSVEETHQAAHLVSAADTAHVAEYAAVVYFGAPVSGLRNGAGVGG